MASRQLQQIIDKCRRSQKHPGQLEIPWYQLPENYRATYPDERLDADVILDDAGRWLVREWATEEEALEDWRARTVGEQMEIS